MQKSIVACREYLNTKLEKSTDLIYGINTGFGALCNTAISKTELSQLQVNLVLSHACGMGEEVPKEIVRRMLLIKAIGLSKGNSGVQLETVERLLFFTISILHQLYTSKEVWVLLEIWLRLPICLCH